MEMVKLNKKFDCQATEFALTKFLEIFMNDNAELHGIEFQGDAFENNDGEDEEED